MGSFPMPTTSLGPACDAQIPKSAIDALSPSDVFVWIVEADPTRSAGPSKPSPSLFPERPAHLAKSDLTSFDCSAPEWSYPSIDFREAYFQDSNRVIGIYVATGNQASPSLQAATWRTIDSLHLTNPNHEPAYRISEKGATVKVQLLERSVSPRDLEGALRSHGVRLNVVSRPVSPSIEGTWVGAQRGKSGVANIIDTDDRTVAVIPRGALGRGLTLDVGRPAKSGQRYWSATNSFCPGEVLAGTGIADLPPAEAKSALKEMGIDVTWRYTITPPGQTGDGVRANTEAPTTTPNGIITNISLRSSKLAVVFVSPPEDDQVKHRFIPTTC
jgi:hypothetical protein